MRSTHPEGNWISTRRSHNHEGGLYFITLDLNQKKEEDYYTNMSRNLRKEQIEAFWKDGILVVKDALGSEDLEPVIREYETAIDRRARRLADAGRIPDLHEEEPFDRRALVLIEEAPELLDGLDISLPLVRNQSEESWFHDGEAIFALIHNGKLLDLVECLIGPRILSNPVQHIRPKLPDRSATPDRLSTPWHQDGGVLLPEADGIFILTVWIPLVDVTLDRGPLEVLPGSHKYALFDHEIAGGGPRVVPRALPDIEPRMLPVPFGGVVFMHTHTIHRTSPNTTDRLRWSIDLRYQDPDLPTGRPVFLSFLVRDREHPDRVMRDHSKWIGMWREAKRNLMATETAYHRWPMAGEAVSRGY